MNGILHCVCDLFSLNQERGGWRMWWMSKSSLVEHLNPFVEFTGRDFLQLFPTCHSNNANSILEVASSYSLLMERILKISTSMPNWVTSAASYCQGEYVMSPRTSGKLIILLYSSIMTVFYVQIRINCLPRNVLSCLKLFFYFTGT